MDVLASIRGIGLDLSLALRRLRQPSVIIATLIIATGLGANTSILNPIKTSLYNDLPFREPDRLFAVWAVGLKQSSGLLSYLDFQFIRGRASSFDELAAVASNSYTQVTIHSTDGPVRVQSALVTPNIFDVLGVVPILGHTFMSSRDASQLEETVVISHNLWLRFFAVNSQIVGSRIEVNNRSLTVVGVMPTNFNYPGTTDIWIPRPFDQQAALDLPVLISSSFEVVGRLRDSVTVQSTQAELRVLSSSGRPARDRVSGDDHYDYRLVSFRKVLGHSFDEEWKLLVLCSTILHSLLVLCFASLILVETAKRRTDSLVLAALGASRFRIIRQAVVGWATISLSSTLGGLLLSIWGTKLLQRLAPLEFARATRFDLSIRSILLSAAVFNCVPVLLAILSNSNIKLANSTADFNQQSGSKLNNPRLTRFARRLAVIQLSLTMLLSMACMLTIRRFLELSSMPLGFVPDNVLTMRLTLPAHKYPAPSDQLNFYNEMIASVEDLPQVASAAITTAVPMRDQEMGFPLSRPGENESSATKDIAAVMYITPRYFRVMGIPLLRGRPILSSDVASSEAVAIINVTAANRFWHTDDVLGEFIPFSGSDARTIKVIGIVPDVRRAPSNEAPGIQVYLPVSQPLGVPMPFVNFVVLTRSSPTEAMKPVLKAISALDPDQPIENATTMRELVFEVSAISRFNSALLSEFACLGTFLLILTTFAIATAFAATRVREIGIRLALGATRHDIVVLFLRRAAPELFAGLTLGMLLSVGAGRIFINQFGAVRYSDRIMMILVPILLATTWCFAFVLAIELASSKPVIMSINLR